MSDTTLRSRRDEWISAGVFDQLRDHALEAYDRIIGLDVSEVAIDESLHKAPCGGEGTGTGVEVVAGRRPGRYPSGMVDRRCQPQRSLLEPTLSDVARVGLLADIETLHLD